MPEPYESWRNGPSGYPYSADQSHPFLTPNGYRLMQDRNRVVDAIPKAFPQYPSYDYLPLEGQFAGEVVGEVVIDGHVIPPGYALIDGQVVPFHESDPPSAQPAPSPSPSPRAWDSSPAAAAQFAATDLLQNIRPSIEFPDPLLLTRTPLTSHFQTQRVARPQASQLRAIGKLLIQVSSDPKAEPASGSAWIAGPSLIMTSAHNLYDFSTGTWAHSVEFLPGFDYYSDHRLPTCRITACSIPHGYFDNPTTNHDIAACFVDRNIGDMVGTQIPMRPVQDDGFFDRTPLRIVGYPAGSGFDFGKQMWESSGKYLFGRRSGPHDDYSPALATNFGGGSSGCPWLMEDSKTKKLVAVGVTSAHARMLYAKGEPNLTALVSPYFGAKLFDSLSDDHRFHEFV
ncbi:MAG: hypothetical protein HKN47_03815 [Pirellulaceae bacterium]|nr:hypothetical protein [Pirellulaceae bacterium]